MNQKIVDPIEREHSHWIQLEDSNALSEGDIKSEARGDLGCTGAGVALERPTLVESPLGINQKSPIWKKQRE